MHPQDEASPKPRAVSVQGWDSTIAESAEAVFSDLLELRGRGWLFRGQSKPHGTIFPSIDRCPMEQFDRREKLALERQSIDTFRSAAKVFGHPGEEVARVVDVIALAVLRHYGTRTRLLDWSRSPHVAAFFAACSHPDEDGEIWAFNEPLYEVEGYKQWQKWPECTVNGDGKTFLADLTAFRAEEPPDWFICVFYDHLLEPQLHAFPRQVAQSGAYSMTARFGQDHAVHIARLLGDPSHCKRFVLPARHKSNVLKRLDEAHGIWRGALFPDAAGAAETAGRLFPRCSIACEPQRPDCTRSRS